MAAENKQNETTKRIITQEIEEDLRDAGVYFREPVVDDHGPDITEYNSGSRTGRLIRGALDKIVPKILADRIRDRAASRALSRLADARSLHKKEIAAVDKSIDHSWMLVTETIKQAILNNPEIRRLVASLVAEPLSEDLPSILLKLLETTDETSDLTIGRMGDAALYHLLSLDVIPEASLVPDISTAPHLYRRGTAVEKLYRYKTTKDTTDSEYKEALEFIKEKPPGVTQSERKLVAMRFRYARDVKLLALMAELSLDNDCNIVFDEGSNSVKRKLPSGTILSLDSVVFESTPELLDPRRWQSRRMIKDRVFSLMINGRRYIMKERKTTRHEDVKEHGHVDGLTSNEEFQVARELSQQGTIEEGDIKLRYEKPLGYVEFRDGYQFCLFEAEPELITYRPLFELESIILSSPDVYRAEYNELVERARKLTLDREDLFVHTARGNDDQGLLTFEEFAKLKSYYLIEAAIDLLSQNTEQRGYSNKDKFGYGFKVDTKDRRALLEILGFDFEYYERSPEQSHAIRSSKVKIDDNTNAIKDKSMDVFGERREVVAASYIILMDMGYPLPEFNL